MCLISDEVAEYLNKQIDILKGNGMQEMAKDTIWLSRAHRIDLLEVCTPTDSGLGQEIERRVGTVYRCGLINGHDLSTRSGLRRTLMVLKDRKPRRVVASPPCGPFCPSSDST